METAGKPDREATSPKDLSHKLNRRAVVGAAIGAGIAAGFPGSAQAVTASSQVSSGELNGRSAWTIANDRLRIGVLAGGGFIGEVALVRPDRSPSINVMRVPHYPTIDPDSYEAERDGDLYGRGMQRRLMAGYMGHFVAFPHFGASSEREFAEDYAQHGEVYTQRWSRDSNSAPDTLEMSTSLPLTRYDFRRTIQLPPGQPVAYVTDTATSLAPFDRPYQWVDHITFGPPFVEPGRNFLDMSPARRMDRNPPHLSSKTERASSVFTGTNQSWALTGDGEKIYITVYNPDIGILVGYLFEASAARWMLDWQEYHRNQFVPFSGRGVARGICIGNSNISGLRAAVRQGALDGIPTFGWFEAMSSVVRRYMMFAIPVPRDFQGVGNVAYHPQEIVLTERGSGRLVRIDHCGKLAQAEAGRG